MARTGARKPDRTLNPKSPKPLVLLKRKEKVTGINDLLCRFRWPPKPMLPPIGLRPRREQGERPQGGDLEFLKLVILSGEESNPDPKLKTCVAEVFWLPDASPCALATEEAEKNRISRMTRKGEGRQTRHCRSERKDQQRRDIVSGGLVFFKISRQSGQDLPKNTKVKRKTIRGQTEFQQLWIF